MEIVVAKNKRAYKDFRIISKLKVGIKLTGQEVRAVKEGKGNLSSSYIKVINGRPSIIGMNIPKYSKSSDLHYVPSRTRLLLLRKSEIRKLSGYLSQKGFMAVPLSLYIKDNLVKLEIGIGKRLKKFEKREILKKRQVEDNIRRELRENI